MSGIPEKKDLHLHPNTDSQVWHKGKAWSNFSPVSPHIGQPLQQSWQLEQPPIVRVSFVIAQKAIRAETLD